LERYTEFGLEEIAKGPSSISPNNLGLLVGKMEQEMLCRYELENVKRVKTSLH